MKRYFSFCTITLIVLLVTVLPGCSDTVKIPTTIPEFSLTGLWEKVVEVTGVQDETARLQSLNFDIGSSGEVRFLYLCFLGNDSKGAQKNFIVTNSKGGLSYRSYEAESVPPNPHPLRIFREIDGVGLASVKPGDGGCSFWIDYQWGDVGYRHAYTNIYHLTDGELIPLKQIIFHTNVPWCTISICQTAKDKTSETERKVTIHVDPQATADDIVVPLEERISQIWFITEDINKAEIVEYLESGREPGYDDFISGIQDVLPEGWEMELITQEGLMGHPHGLNEPLFRIDFVDRTHQFEDSGGRAHFPSLRLYCYDIQEKDAILETIEQEKMYSWDVPDYFEETAEYIVVTSPLYINGGCFSDETMLLYEPLDKALKDYFDVTFDFSPPVQRPDEMPSLRIVSLTSLVRPGAEASLVAQTMPGVECDMTIDYGPSGISTLPRKTADGNGRVSWTWTALKFRGIWQIEVIASYDGKTTSQHTLFTVE